ncbi:DinB family protein [Kineosporia mesophila]|uniref:DinB family protein n=1 Tax=Kineosporia mesophila TaxID=566012 RepID=A0ABP6YV35_9ACTN|nr:DinB family protein [Kineosporia mesophila]MCD5351811.1 DinB family protein [Kineosporia mesophila]
MADDVAVDVDEHGRPEPPFGGTEAETLIGFLEYLRATFAWKTGGLDAAGFSVTVPPSDMTLGGMVKHLAYVEDWWFGCFLLGAEPSPPWDTVDWNADGDWDWHSAADDTPEQVLALWQASVDRSREAVAKALTQGDMSQLAPRVHRTGRAPSLRWIVTHMIEEYARHCGHADLLRQAVDGSVGE